LAKNIDFAMISIGKPEIGKELLAHLGLPEDFPLYADPVNAVYDDLDLNRGLDTLFFKPSTPFAFLDRFTQKDGMKELNEVLGKWNKAFYIPPKQDQAFIQGGTFIFDGFSTVFAHYDESVGAHAKIERVVELAVDTANIKTASPISN